MMQHCFVAEGYNGPLKPEAGATHFWSRPYNPEGPRAKRALELSGSLNERSATQ